jgi:hypothetical protein
VTCTAQKPYEFAWSRRRLFRTHTGIMLRPGPRACAAVKAPRPCREKPSPGTRTNKSPFVSSTRKHPRLKNVKNTDARPRIGTRRATKTHGRLTRRWGTSPATCLLGTDWNRLDRFGGFARAQSVYSHMTFNTVNAQETGQHDGALKVGTAEPRLVLVAKAACNACATWGSHTTKHLPSDRPQIRKN